jgi:hypothetical protein
MQQIQNFNDGDIRKERLSRIPEQFLTVHDNRYRLASIGSASTVSPAR